MSIDYKYRIRVGTNLSFSLSSILTLKAVIVKNSLCQAGTSSLLLASTIRLGFHISYVFYYTDALFNMIMCRFKQARFIKMYIKQVIVLDPLTSFGFPLFWLILSAFLILILTFMCGLYWRSSSKGLRATKNKLQLMISVQKLTVLVMIFIHFFCYAYMLFIHIYLYFLCS